MSTGAAAIYARKSKMTGKGESIENQVELCRDYIRCRGESLAGEIYVYTDEGFSGGNLDRPGFKKMIQAAEKGEIGTIIVYRLDRISRNIGDFSKLIDEMTGLGIEFVSIKEQFDTGTPMGRAMMYIASVFSQLERETIAERIRDNMRELAKTGRWLGGTTPTGYISESVSIVQDDGKIRKMCRLKVIPEEADTVRQIYELFQKTGSLTKTESELMKRNILSKNGRYFTRFTIRSILHNPVYAAADRDVYEYFREKGTEIYSAKEDFDGSCGIIAYNRTDQKKGKTKIYLPEDQWIISLGQHEGIVSGYMWTEVQRSLEKNSSGSYRQPRKNEALLTGRIFCQCGGRMYPRMHKSGDKITYSYVCKIKERSGGKFCSCRNISGNILDKAVVDAVCSCDWNRKVFSDRLKNEWKFAESGGANKEKSKGSRAELDKRIENLKGAMLDISEKEIKESIEKRIEELKKEYQNRGESSKDTGNLSSGEYGKLLEELCDFKGCVSGAATELKRRLVQTAVIRAELCGNDVIVAMAGAD